MNAGFHTWWGREIVFADAMTRGLEITKVVNGIMTFDLAPVIPLGEVPPLLGEGWPDFAQLAPGEKAGSYLFSGMEGTIPDGRVTPWVVTWDGIGDCSLAGPPVFSEQNRTPNRVEAFVDPTVANGNAQIALFIDTSSIIDPVRNVHVWLPGMEAGKAMFWPPYIAMVEEMNHGLGPYTWRTLDWSRANDYGRKSGNLPFVFDLAGRIKPSSPTQGTMRGMCPEFMVAFCNETQSNLHFQIPHRTDDLSEADYVTFITDTLVRIRDGSPAVPGINNDLPFAGLDPNLTVSVELSNEIWNSGFPVYYWMQNEAQRKGITFEAQIASQIEIVFGVADTVFSGQERPRLRKYIGAFTGDPSFLSSLGNNFPVDFEIDSVGPAAYFGPAPSVIAGWMVGADPQTGDCPNCPSVLEVMNAARARISDLRILLQVHRNIVDTWENPDGSTPSLEVYEGGQHIAAGFQPWWPEANAAQVMPEMYDAYIDEFVPMLIAEGVELINWYSFMSDQNPFGGNGAGPFGMWNDMDQTITLPVPETYLDEGVPKAAAIYKGPPAKN
jgi:hypothetical protein